ncbi:LamB/YcsF family protein [Leekyejoonella antrihumi]|uniref:5-oxoprolinase subunit A n=1 Tax=Leekyejoonella antrihumi TaxID=1660198 RepID=A0A563E4E2_9MICO|nr:5-oxoprolinase subunit PxpA [Leekyejoonella antrihumi]TWP37398.1 LamB/YcsF family protein [Leekyejoonella antrihumi]
MSDARIDLNADVGESFGRWELGDDGAMLATVTSANVACGFHAGDPATLVRTCATAAERDVRVGAQVGYRDLPGFGRRFIDVAPADLFADIVYQIGALDAIARSQGSRVTYVKPHGALYNTVVTHREQAEAVVAAVRAVDPGLPLLGLPGSVLLQHAASLGQSTVAEAFADRGYTAAGTLVPRQEAGALLNDPEVVARRVVRLVTTHTLEAVDGTQLHIDADSVCLHGDSPGAVAMAKAVRSALTLAHIEVEAFT